MNLEWSLKIWMVTPELRITLSMRGNSPSSSSSVIYPLEAVYAALVITWPMVHTGVGTSSAESAFHD